MKENHWSNHLVALRYPEFESGETLRVETPEEWMRLLEQAPTPEARYDVCCQPLDIEHVRERFAYCYIMGFPVRDLATLIHQLSERQNNSHAPRGKKAIREFFSVRRIHPCRDR